nr:polysaccharide pyruvyl transferase family protein [uncultured Sphingobacterium sp.]
MRVGILTLPLHNNYGGILQAYALMFSLNKLGHETWLINFQHNSQIPKWKLPLVFSKRAILKYVLKKDVVIFQERQHKELNQNIKRFIETYVQPQTHILTQPDELAELTDFNFGAYVVGSDQVWREKYNRKFIKKYFFDFVDGSKSKKISYAASFGVDIWEYDEAITKELSLLAKQFNAVSVREDSAVDLCHEHLQVEANFHVDPTMLLEPSDYLNLINKHESSTPDGELLTYILDSSPEKSSLVTKVSELMDFKIFSIGFGERSATQTVEAHPSVTYWLKGFSDAKFVITDSFHGCVFSILFNKPFLVVGNDARGMARFNSLLRLFNLEERLVLNVSEVTEEVINSKINWEWVNSTLNKKREEAFSYFHKSLN